MQQLQVAPPLATNIEPPPKDEDQGTHRRRKSKLAAN